MEHPNIVVTGANGFIGSALCSYLRDKGCIVTGLVRTRKAGCTDDVFVETGEIEQERFWQTVLPYIRKADIVIHMASMIKPESDDEEGLNRMRAVNVEGTQKLVDAAMSHGVKRFVYLSSISVNGTTTTDRPFNEDSDTRPQGQYANSKYDAEQYVKQAATGGNIETVIVRPPMVLGKGIRSSLFGILAAAVRRHLPLPLLMLKNRRAYISRDSIVDLLYRCAVNDKAANQVFVAADDNISLKEVAIAIEKELGVRALLFPLPGFVIRLGGYVTGKSAWASVLLDNIEIDSHKARTLLGWHPLQTKSEVLSESVRGLM